MIPNYESCIDLILNSKNQVVTYDDLFVVGIFRSESRPQTSKFFVGRSSLANNGAVPPSIIVLVRGVKSSELTKW